MALQDQIHVYSIDTSCFYYEDEMEIHKELSDMYIMANKIKKKLDKLQKCRKSKLKKIKVECFEDSAMEVLAYSQSLSSHIKNLESTLHDTRQEIHREKNKLKELLASTNMARTLNANMVNDKNIVSIFMSTLTRTIVAKKDELSKDLIIIQTYYFEVLKDIVKNGFYFNGEKYIMFTASAGQIRTKKTVFVREKVWKTCEKTLTCGLSKEEINKQGGMNINKYLAYLALTNSATELWEDFDIDKAIVVDDLETIINCEVDFIDEKSYSIKRDNKPIPIEHTDGCGMLLYPNYKKSKMARLPWMKGLLSPFPYKKWIREAKKDEANAEIKSELHKVKDIYGKEWDILNGDIEVIFTRSQFKMHKFYSNDEDKDGKVIKYGWDKYKEAFKKYKCEAGKCNIEPDADKFNDVKLNYQLIQTITDITDDEIEYLCSATNKNIEEVGGDRDIMLELMGANAENENKNAFQEALSLYPELLKDEYSKTSLKEVKKSYVKSAKAGKLKIEGAYTFIIPDLYAFCERLFLRRERPKGLLKDGEVFCKLYEGRNELDCLRSPHLYREHVIRSNEVTKENKKWFKTNGLYVSTHDAISKIIMCDWDGDTSLITPDEKFIGIVKRNLEQEKTVPLYYEMKTAKVEDLNSESLYDGMTAAYKGGNIGMIANEITKVWNSDKIHEEDAIKTIKLCCMESNFTIDFAKTLYKTERPKHINRMMKQYIGGKVPYFFNFAKDKKGDNVEKINNSTMNRVVRAISSDRLDFEFSKIKGFDKRMLMSAHNRMSNKDTRAEILKAYKHYNVTRNHRVSYEDRERNNLRHNNLEVRKAIIGKRDKDFVIDILVEELFKEGLTISKSLFWDCFGWDVVKNIKKNLIKEYGTLDLMYCEVCGKRVVREAAKVYCEECYIKQREVQNREKALRYYYRNKTLPN